MASGTAARRPPVHTSLSPHPKTVVSVEEWEAKAPLGDIETRSVSLIKAASERTALPFKVCLPSAHSVRIVCQLTRSQV